MADDDDDDDLSVDWGAALAEDDSIELDERQQAALSDIQAEPDPAPGGPTLGEAMGFGDAVEAVYDVEIDVRAVLGMSIMPMSQILKLGRGAVVELDRGVGDPIDVFSADQKIADGEVVVVEDKLAVSIGNIMRSKRSL